MVSFLPCWAFLPRGRRLRGRCIGRIASGFAAGETVFPGKPAQSSARFANWFTSSRRKGKGERLPTPSAPSLPGEGNGTRSPRPLPGERPRKTTTSTDRWRGAGGSICLKKPGVMAVSCFAISSIFVTRTSARRACSGVNTKRERDKAKWGLDAGSMSARE